MKKRLGKLEFQVMKIVWENGSATVRDVWEKFYPKKRLAYTTVATTMRKLEEKGFLRHQERERTYVYLPLVDQDVVSKGMLTEMIDGLFDGSAAKLITTLVQGEHLTRKELEQIHQIILDHKEGDKNG